MKASCNKLMQNIKDSYKTAALVVNIVTSMRNCTDHTEHHETFNRNDSTYPGTRKLNDKYNKLYQSHTSRTHHYSGNSLDQLQDSSRQLYAKTKHENRNTGTQNSK